MLRRTLRQKKVPRKARDVPPLDIWHFVWTMWYAACEVPPSKALQSAMATALRDYGAGATGTRPVSYRMLMYFKARDDWRAFYELVRLGGIEATRRLFRGEPTTYEQLVRASAVIPHILAAISGEAPPDPVPPPRPSREPPAVRGVPVELTAEIPVEVFVLPVVELEREPEPEPEHYYERPTLKPSTGAPIFARPFGWSRDRGLPLDRDDDDGKTIWGPVLG